jgi:hypothetical protein
MVRAMLTLTLPLVLGATISAQATSVLHIKVTLADAAGTVSPVPRHALLISDNPASSAPRLITTTLDGTADVRLRPGSYTIESDRPVLFQGKAYQWTQTIDLLAGRDSVLELTVGNAEVVSSPKTAGGGAPLDAETSFVIPQWQDSVVAVWTPLTRATAFVVDPQGLVVTNERVVRAADNVEVQLTSATKVAGRVLASDPATDAAVLRVNPDVIASIRPVPLPCSTPASESGQEVFTIGVPSREPKGVFSGKIDTSVPGATLANFVIDPSSAGGPVFTSAGTVIGLTTIVGEEDEARRGDARIVPAAAVCALLQAARTKLSGAPPSATLLPVDPPRDFPMAALKAIVEKRAGSLNPYQITLDHFEIAFITPVISYGAQYQAERARERARESRAKNRNPRDADGTLTNRLLDFGNWSWYVEDFPPVLLVRVTPRMTEGFWTKVGRGVARTQGMVIPPLKRFKDNFSRLRAFCDGREMTPIHPFKIEQRITDALTLSEGLYVFSRDAFTPTCGSISLTVFSDNDAAKPDAATLDPKLIQQIREDFSPYRR